MKKYTKRLFSLMMATVMLFGFTVTGFAIDSSVTFEANEKKFNFNAGQEYLLSDLFPNFKNLMPGDTVEQTVTVKNSGKAGYTTKIYMKALGEATGTEQEILNTGKPVNHELYKSLKLNVETVKDSKNLFTKEHYAAGTGLEDWTLLGSLRKGGEVELKVSVTVPLALTGEDMENVSAGIIWAFKVEEIPDPVPDNPHVPDTGDTTNTLLYGGIFAVSAAALVCLVVLKKKREE